MTKRFKDALQIVQGAGNMIAIARSLHEACQECMAENMDTSAIWNDPAVRLIVHQMAYLTHQADGMPLIEYAAMEAICKQRVTAQTAAQAAANG